MTAPQQPTLTPAPQRDSAWVRLLSLPVEGKLVQGFGGFRTESHGPENTGQSYWKFDMRHLRSNSENY